MKTRFISIVIMGLFVTIGAFVYHNNVQKQPSYDSPEEALNQEEDLPLEVTEMIAKKYVEENTIAYIVFLSNDDIENYLAVAQLVKGENGWYYNEYLGLGHASENNIGNASAKEGFAGGFIAENVEKTFLYNREAILSETHVNGIKLWLLHGVTLGEFDSGDLKFYDKNGNQIK